MAADISTLSIVVKSDGIKEAAKSLNDLAASAAKASAAIPKVTSETQKEEQATRTKVRSTEAATAAAEKYISKLQLKAQTLGKSASATAALTAVQRGFSAEAVKQAAEMGAAIDKQKAAMDSTSKSGTLFNNTVKSMISAFILYKSVGFAKSIIEAGDSWAMMASRLKVATGSMQEANKVQGELYAMAQSLRVPLEDSTRLYTRMLVPMKALGKTSEDVMKVTEGVGLALQLNGSTGAEASSVMLQFSQSMAAGRLNGAELNAVLEGAPPIIRAIEAELVRTGKGFSQTGKTIKQMGADGELGIDLITNAIKNALPGWRKDFAELPITVDSALTVIKNAWTKAMGEMSQDTELNKNLSKALLSVIDIIPMVRDTMISAISFITDNIKGLTFVIETLLAGTFVSWAVNVGVALTSGAVAAGTFGTAIAAAATTVGAFLGPIGLVIAAVGLLYGAYKLWWDKAPAAEAAITKSVEEESRDRIIAINKETAAIDKRNRASGLGAVTPSVNASAQTAGIDYDIILKKEENLGRLIAKRDSTTDIISKNNQSRNIAWLQGEIDKDKASLRTGILRQEELVATQKQGTEEKYLAGLRKTWQKDFTKEEALKSAAINLTGENLKTAIALINSKDDAKAAKTATTAINKQEQAMAALNAKLKDQMDIQAKLEEAGAPKKQTANEKALNLLKEQLDIAKGIAKAGIEAQVAKAEEIVLQEKANTLKRDSADLDRRVKAQESELAIIQENYDLQLSMLSLGDKEAANQEKIFTIQKKYAEQIKELNKDVSEGTAGDYAGRLNLIQTSLDKEVAMHNKAATDKLASESRWQDGAKKAVANYYDEAQNLSKQYEGLFSNGMKSMEDAIVEFATTGKLSFKDFANTIIAEFARMQAKQMVSSIMGKGGESGGGILGSILSFLPAMFGAGSAPSAVGGISGGLTTDMNAWASAYPSAKGNAFSGGAMTTKFADGGAFTNGIVSKPTGFNMGLMGEAGPEAIMPLTRTADGSLGVATDGGSSKANGDTVVTYAPVINIDSRTDRAEVTTLVNKAVQQGNAQLVEQLQRARRL